MEPKLVTLKNGYQERESLVIVVMASLRKLSEEKPICVYELVMKCRDNNHQFWGDTEKDLQGLVLVQSDGSVHSSIRNIVLSAAEGEGLTMVIKSPVAKDTKK